MAAMLSFTPTARAFNCCRCRRPSGISFLSSSHPPREVCTVRRPHPDPLQPACELGLAAGADIICSL